MNKINNQLLKWLTFSLVFVLVLFLSTSLSAKEYEIKIDNNEHSIVADAGGCSYQWYKDGSKLEGEIDRFLAVNEGGTYEVEIVDETGSVSAPTVTVAVTAMGAIIKIYTIGDSTVQDYVAGYYPRKGWGQVLPAFFNTANVQIINKAVGGTSSKSFYNNYWPAVRNLLQPGDFVFIQFGINDAKHTPPDPNRDAATGGVFEGFLKSYIDETRAKGAFPVLVTTVRRNAWNADGVTVYDAYHSYPVVTRTVAKDNNVPLIDLDAKLKVAMEAAGKTYTTRFWHNNYVAGEYPNYANGNKDDVHFQEMGAINNASLVIQGIKELSTDVNVSKLIPFIKPQYQIGVGVNPVGADSVTTRTAMYPQGLTVTLKTIPDTKSNFQKWNNAANAQFSTATLTTVTSGNAATYYTAVYQGATTTCNATISALGATTFCQGGKVTLTASAGLSYVWKNGTTQVGTSSTYTATSSGSYTVEVTNTSNCKSTSAATVVTVTAPTLWYADTDGDGKGDPNVSQSACTKPTGYVADKSDLCPTDANKIAAGNCGCGKTEESCLDCNGTVNGTAKLDNCGRCIAGTTGKTACVSVGEAETDACAYEGVLETTNLGFKGTSYINVSNVVGSSITFNVMAANAGTATISFRYANGSVNDRPAQITLNNTILTNNLRFLTTGTFTTWKVIDLSLTLLKGSNSIKLASTTAEGLANIDQIGYVSSGLTKGSCLVTGLEEEVKNSFLIAPNPFIETIHLEGVGEYTVYDLAGIQLEKGDCKSKCEIGKNLSTGVYVLELHVGNVVNRMKISKQ